MRRLTTGFGMLVLSGMVLAQTSTSFKLEEHTLNAGGTPSQGSKLSSASFSITLASIGEGVVATGLSSASFRIDAGFDAAYPPPGEVAATCGAPGEPCLQFLDPQTLAWPAERSAGRYNLYRNSMSDEYDQCLPPELPGTTVTDTAIPTIGDAFFYLATVDNRLGEEGAKGFRSDGTERAGAVCP